MPPMTGTRMIAGPQGLNGVKTLEIVDERELAEEKQVVDQPDQATEHHGAKASDHADDQREQRERQEA